VLVDPVVPTMGRDLEVLRELDLRLMLTIETHVHADHITSALQLREKLGSKIGFPAVDKLECADLQIEEGEPIHVGNVVIDPLYTPGHTSDHFSFYSQGRVLTGDSLLIDGCGRTDFQNGDAGLLFHSIREKLFTLDDDTLVYPGHDYKGRYVSSIAQEKMRNPRISQDTLEQQFLKTMSELNLPNPNFIEYAVKGNLLCGECPSDLPNNMEKYCQQMTESPQG